MPKGDKLTPKQRAFLTAYLETGNASEAYRRAYDAEGMSQASIKNEASKLLAHPDIAPTVERFRAEQEERTRKAAEKLGCTKEWLVEQYMLLAGYDVGEISSWDESGAVIFKDSTQLTKGQRAAIQSVTQEVSPKGAKSIKLAMANKQPALDSLSKILGLFRPDAAGADGEGLNLTITIQ